MLQPEADGHRHQLIVQLGAPSNQASGSSAAASAAYPLRLIGVSVGYNMPPDPAALAADGDAVITFSSIAASPSPEGRFAAPFAYGQALAGWRTQTNATGLETIINQNGGQARGSLVGPWPEARTALKRSNAWSQRR